MLDNRTITFLTVCEEMNFTRAAEKLHISQPAVTQHIQYIESYYHVKLFRFIGKKLLLTDAGKLLRDTLTSIHNNEIYLKEQLTYLTDRRKPLHFGATLTVGEFMIAQPLSQFLHNYEAASITVTVANTNELLQKLDNGSIDFAILEGDYPHHLYRHLPYTVENFIPVCSPNYQFTTCPQRNLLTLHDLIEERLLLREEGSGTRMILEQSLSCHELNLIDFHNIITIGNMNTIKELVLSACGITFLYETAVEKELLTGQIQKIELQDFDVQHEISIVWKKDNLFEKSLFELFAQLFGDRVISNLGQGKL